MGVNITTTMLAIPTLNVGLRLLANNSLNLYKLIHDMCNTKTNVLILTETDPQDESKLNYLILSHDHPYSAYSTPVGCNREAGVVIVVTNDIAAHINQEYIHRHNSGRLILL